MNTNISEETIAAMIEAAQNIAADSTAMRAALVEIAAKLQPLIKSAGIEFASDDPIQIWTACCGYVRLCVRRTEDGWMLATEEIIPQDGMDASDGCKMFDDGGDWAVPFATTSRTNIENVAERLPAFLLAYSDELEQRGMHYADMRQKAERMLAATTPVEKLFVKE